MVDKLILASNMLFSESSILLNKKIKEGCNIPANFKIGFEFEYSKLYPTFVKDVYSVFLNRYVFNSDKGNKLSQIIDWNQQLLEEKFELGLDQPHCEGYKNLELKFEGKSCLNLFWVYEDELIFLYCSIPQHEVFEGNGTMKVQERYVKNFCEIATEIWSLDIATTIQACREVDGGHTLVEDIEDGELPIIHPFCIIKEKHYNLIAKDLVGEIKYKIQKISNSGVLIFAD